MRRPTGQEVRHALALAAILGAVALVHYHPHWNPLTGRTYDYPVHMDEYVHWGYSMAVADQGNITFANPFTGGAAGEFTVEEHLHERGYHAYLGTFQGVTGVEWLDLFRYGPAVVAVLLALTVYIMCRRFDAGLEGALLVACIPTTLRFLGPGFMVPIVFSLPFLAAGLFLLFHTRGWGGLAVFFLIAAALWPIHVIGAFGMFALALLYGLFLLSRDPRRAIVIIAMAALPFLASWNFYAKLLDTGVLVVPGLPAEERILLFFGVLPLAAALIGIVALFNRRDALGSRDGVPGERSEPGWTARGREGAKRPVAGGDASEFAAGGALAAGILLTELIILARLYYDTDPFLLYDRSYMLLYFQCVIAGGIGLAEVRHLGKRWLDHFQAPLLTRIAPGLMVGVSLLLAGVVVAASVKPQLEQAYYVVMDEEDYESYTAAAAAINGTYQRAVVEGISTMPFSILTGLPTLYVHFPSSPGADPPYLQDFFRGGAKDTYLLAQNGVSVVVTDRNVTNPDLVPVGGGVYLLRYDYAERMAQGLAPR